MAPAPGEHMAPGQAPLTGTGAPGDLAPTFGAGVPGIPASHIALLQRLCYNGPRQNRWS